VIGLGVSNVRQAALAETRTIAAQALGAIEPETKAVALPCTSRPPSSAIRQPVSGRLHLRPRRQRYRAPDRSGHWALEGAHESMLFGSGMAAATSVVLALPPGSRVLAPQVCYWGFATG